MEGQRKHSRTTKGGRFNIKALQHFGNSRHNRLVQVDKYFRDSFINLRSWLIPGTGSDHKNDGTSKLLCHVARIMVITCQVGVTVEETRVMWVSLAAVRGFKGCTSVLEIVYCSRWQRLPCARVPAGNLNIKLVQSPYHGTNKPLRFFIRFDWAQPTIVCRSSPDFVKLPQLPIDMLVRQHLTPLQIYQTDMNHIIGRVLTPMAFLTSHLRISHILFLKRYPLGVQLLRSPCVLNTPN